MIGLAPKPAAVRLAELERAMSQPCTCGGRDACDRCRAVLAASLADYDSIVLRRLPGSRAEAGIAEWNRAA